MGGQCEYIEPYPCSGSCGADILGAPRSSIRFSTSAAMATSVACRPFVRELSPLPMTRFHLETLHSTRARQLCPEAFYQPIHRSGMLWIAFDIFGWPVSPDAQGEAVCQVRILPEVRHHLDADQLALLLCERGFG
jgi:hypothetical protein